jgi:hypothetical protein
MLYHIGYFAEFETLRHLTLTPFPSIFPWALERQA